ncbi:MAG: hypothetical protein WCX71_01210 [Candidatus Buchananbacteria bacterium]
MSIEIRIGESELVTEEVSSKFGYIWKKLVEVLREMFDSADYGQLRLVAVLPKDWVRNQTDRDVFILFFLRLYLGESVKPSYEVRFHFADAASSQIKEMIEQTLAQYLANHLSAAQEQLTQLQQIQASLLPTAANIPS